VGGGEVVLSGGSVRTGEAGEGATGTRWSTQNWRSQTGAAGARRGIRILIRSKTNTDSAQRVVASG
jgi:hypothetical protein